MIPSVFQDQSTLLKAIIDLHLQPIGVDRFELDPTYSKGMFYKDIPEPYFKFDLCPQRPDVAAASCGMLPMVDGTISSIMVDLPFQHAHGKESIIGNRFGSYPSQKKIQEVNNEAILEAYRLLVSGGILALKCQDTVESGKQVWNHIEIYNMGLAAGLTAEDLFVLVAERRIQGFNHARQLHARKFHSYFWVFKKIVRRKNNNLER